MLKKILKGLLYLVLAFLAIGFFLPGSSHVTRSIETTASAATVFEQIHEFKNWKNWSAWYEDEPDMKLTFGQSSAGLGGSYAWEGSKNGKGSMTNLEVTPPQYIRQKLSFDGTNPSTVTWKITEAGGKTTIIVAMDSDYGLNPIARYFGLMMEQFVGKPYERCLAKMKTHCEAYPLPVVAPILLGKDSASVKK